MHARLPQADMYKIGEGEREEGKEGGRERKRDVHGVGPVGGPDDDHRGTLLHAVHQR